MGVNQPKVSVVIPCFNAENTIVDQLNALAKQSYDEKWELVIADNGSTDNTLDVVIEFAQKSFLKINIINASQKKGAAFARNIGVDHSNGDIILFCDADDVVEVAWMEEMVNALDSFDIVAPKWEHYLLSDKRFAEIRCNSQVSELINVDFDPPLPHAGASGLGIKRYLHYKTGGFDTSFLAAEDWDYCWKAQLAGYKIGFVPSAIIHIRHRTKLINWVKQSYFWGTYYSLIVKKYGKKGVKSPSYKKTKLKWKRLLKNLHNISEQNYRYKLLWELFHLLGQLKGTFKFRKMSF